MITKRISGQQKQPGSFILQAEPLSRSYHVAESICRIYNNIDQRIPILIFSGRYHIISNASLVNNCIMLLITTFTLTNSPATKDGPALHKFYRETQISFLISLKALSHYNVLANVCRRMKYISSTLAYAEI